MGPDLSGVDVDLTAMHLDATMDEGWHEHTFRVTAYRLADPWTDGRAARVALETLLHSIAPVGHEGRRWLSAEMWSNEKIAQACLVLGNVVKVTVERPGFRVERWAR